MLKIKLHEDLKAAMKRGDAPERDALRLLLAGLLHAEKQGGGALADEDALQAVARLVKQTRSSIEEYQRLDQVAMVAKLEGELVVYLRYAPVQMSEAQVAAIVAEAIAVSGATGAADMGKVMRLVMPRVQGKADGGLVNRLVKQALETTT